jgi:hypothetical protein
VTSYLCNLAPIVWHKLAENQDHVAVQFGHKACGLYKSEKQVMLMIKLT